LLNIVSIMKYSTERINLNIDYNKNWRFPLCR
jgi:hypothetical protein